MITFIGWVAGDKRSDVLLPSSASTLLCFCCTFAAPLPGFGWGDEAADARQKTTESPAETHELTTFDPSASPRTYDSESNRR